MNYFQLNKIFKSFSEPEQRFIKEKTIEANYTIKQWMILLQKVAAYDEANDRIRKKTVTWLVVLGLATFFMIFIFWYLSIILGVAFIIIMSMRNKLRSNDLSNHLRLFLIPLLKVLNDKAGIKAPLALKLDFRPHTQQKMEKKYKVGNRTIRQYHPKWISGSVVLKDKSALELHLLDDLKKLTVKKTNARGKTKIKGKIKNTHFLLIKLTLLRELYQLKNVLDEQIISDQDDRKIILKAKLKHKVTSAEDVLSINQFLELLEQMYKSVEPLPGSMPFQSMEGTAESDEAQVEPGMTVEPANTALLAGGAFFMWSAYDFGNEDYDTFDYEAAPVFSDELDSDSIFDS